MVCMATAGHMYCVWRNTSPVKSEDVYLLRIVVCLLPLAAIIKENILMKKYQRETRIRCVTIYVIYMLPMCYQTTSLVHEDAGDREKEKQDAAYSVHWVACVSEGKNEFLWHSGEVLAARVFKIYLANFIYKFAKL